MHIFYFVSLLWKKFYILFCAFFRNSVRGNFFIYPIITTECLTSASYVCGNAVSYTIFSLSALLFCISNVLFCVYFVPMIFGFVRRFIRWKFLISYSHSCIYYFVYFGYIVDFENSLPQIIAIYATTTITCVTSISYVLFIFVEMQSTTRVSHFWYFYSYFERFCGLFLFNLQFWGEMKRWTFLISRNHFCTNFICFAVYFCCAQPILSICAIIPIKCITSANFAFLCECRTSRRPGHEVTRQRTLRYKNERKQRCDCITVPLYGITVPYRTVPYRIMTFSL